MNNETITKVVVIDFDGTLIDTIGPEEGKKIWREKTGEDYPHKGWWGKRETLDIDIFENKPFNDIVSELNKANANVNTFTALCTGRITPLTNQVKAILNKNNLHFDDVVLTGDKRFNQGASNTLTFKINYLSSLQGQFPNLQEIEFFDDRFTHHATFTQWGKLQNIPVKIHLIDRGEEKF